MNRISSKLTVATATAVLCFVVATEAAAYTGLRVGSSNHSASFRVPISQGGSQLVHALGPGAATATGVSVSGTGVSASIVERLPMSLGVRVTVNQNTPIGERTVTVTYPMGSDTFRIRVTQNPRITHFTSQLPTYFDGCTPHPIDRTVVMAGERLQSGSHMKVAPHACPSGTTMSLVQASATSLTVRAQVPTTGLSGFGPNPWAYNCSVRYFDQNNPWVGHAVSPDFGLRLNPSCSSGGGGTSSPPSSGGTTTTPTPGVPSPISPQAGATCVASAGSALPPLPQTVSFSWAAATGVAGSLPYELQIRRGNAMCADQPTASTPPTCIWEPAQTVTTAYNLDHSTTYSWRVRGVHRTGSGHWQSATGKTVGAWSPWRSFTTRAPLPAIQLTSPHNNAVLNVGASAVGGVISLAWQAPPCAVASYDVEVYKSGSPFPSNTVTASSPFAHVQLDKGTYTWRVRAATGPWSQLWSFKVQ